MQTEETPTYTDVDDIPFLAVSFPVQGRQLPADHGYLLYSAITKHVPSLHSAAWLGIELISGLPWGKGVIALPARSASLRLRLPVDKLAHVLRLAGARLEIDGYAITAGSPCRPPACTRVFSVRTYCHHQEIHRTRTISRRSPKATGPARHRSRARIPSRWPHAEPPYHYDSRTQGRRLLARRARLER